jgi:hypothetical protein
MFIRNKRVLVKKQHIQCVVDNLILLPAFKDKDILETVKLFSAHLSFIILILFAMNAKENVTNFYKFSHQSTGILKD